MERRRWPLLAEEGRKPDPRMASGPVVQRPRGPCSCFPNPGSKWCRDAALGSPPQEPPALLPCFVGCLFSSSSTANTAADGRSLKGLQVPRPFRNHQESRVDLDFLRLHGFDGSYIKKLVQICPRCLCCNVEDNVAPKIQSFREMGFLETDLVEIILSNPCILHLRFHDSVLPKLKMWEGLIGSRESLVKHIKNTWFFRCSIEKRYSLILISLGMSAVFLKKGSRVARQHPNFLVRSLDSLRL
ncbi:hypothetical protein B296_00054456 [Ensete ventricosum]|uniref:Uncharacterized protein n=1 Tax=Ensete ventricosum TaxID=4639 RepID=A0A426WZL0_ENSVE|nr:hypothetical protein B296_00054456 [Ensete ventricosum]